MRRSINANWNKESDLKWIREQRLLSCGSGVRSSVRAIRMRRVRNAALLLHDRAQAEREDEIDHDAG